MLQETGSSIPDWIAAVGAWAAAVIALAGALWTARLTNRVQAAIADRFRETELIVAAFGHLGGGSQERAVGIAALGALRLTIAPQRWPEFEGPVQRVLITQLQYVLTGGRNRWEVHEIENLRSMASWFLDDDVLRFGDAQERMTQSIDAYRASWERRARTAGEEYKDGGRADVAAVDGLIADLDRWLRRRPDPPGVAG